MVFLFLINNIKVNLKLNLIKLNFKVYSTNTLWLADLKLLIIKKQKFLQAA